MANEKLTKLAYQTLQNSKNIAGLLHKELSKRVMEIVAPDVVPSTNPFPKELLEELRQSIIDLNSIDWIEADTGIYPKTLLFEAPWIKWATNYPLVWLDLPATWERRRSRNTRDIPNKIDSNIYPDYYLQNFHHQTDGYLSDHSANLYDLQVEILFNGNADSMRRRILSPLKKGLESLNKNNTANIKILDIATGTGRTLKQIRGAFPEAELIGLDLSEAYLKQASRYINNRNKDLAQLIRGNAEELPFASEIMQAITCVFLFHELPRKARQNVLNECWRVLQPGGTFVLADSIQIADSPQFISVMEDFYKVFHEPYYKDYINDDIEYRLRSSGFNVVNSTSHFMTRVWTATKPT